MSVGEHTRELGSLLSAEPVWWLAGTIAAAFLLEGDWFDRILASAVYGLAIGYPAFCVQMWRFLRLLLTNS